MYPLVCFVVFVTAVTLVLPGHGHADKETLHASATLQRPRQQLHS
jgi:hypothetical protein